MKKPKTFLVTGGNGFIGSHMCKQLVSEGHRVHFVDNFAVSKPQHLHSFGQFYEADIGNPNQMEQILKQVRPETVFHFAARAVVPEGEERPFFYYKENVAKTLVLLEKCHEQGVRKFVFSSTCAVYGNPQTDRFSEDHEQIPQSTYGQTKRLIELALQDLSQKGLMNCVVLRYFNVIGASPDGDLGENHDPETHVIPNLCLAHLSGKKSPFSLYGTDFPTPDGTAIRDYVHVMDLVRAHSLAASYLEGKKGLFSFNLGTGVGHSVKEVIKIFEEVTGESLEVVKCGRRSGDNPKLVANPSKAERELGFRCEFSLKQGIEHTLAWLKKVKGVRA